MASDSGEQFNIRPAVRYATPQIMSIWGVTFSGKTYGALMLAAGLVKPGGKIGFLDTENGRGCMYADDPDVRRMIPNGYLYLDLHPPFHPRRYIAAIEALIAAGCGPIIIDSGSHEWEGDGGCQDIVEADRGRWNKAKLWNKRFTATIRYAPVDIILCLRAQEKIKIIDKKDSADGQEHQIPLGIQPICEKNTPFDLGLAFLVDGEILGQPATHHAHPIKYPKALGWLFDNWKPQLLTPEIGRRIREWNEGAPAPSAKDTTDRLLHRAETIASEGRAAYQRFWSGITKEERLALAASHPTLRASAEAADKAKAPAQVGSAPLVDNLPDPVPLGAGARRSWMGSVYVVIETQEGIEWQEEAASV